VTEVRVTTPRAFIDGIPYNKALGIRVVEVVRQDRADEPGRAVFVLPYDARLVGNADTGGLHGGAITALLDAACGCAVFAALVEWVPIATLDLRIDYLRAAEPPRDVTARAICYRIARNVAFARAIAFHDDDRDPIASAVGTFMLSTKPGTKPKPSGSEPSGEDPVRGG
jgi:uncharacterized protein (TIGR00369 family)